MDDDRTIAEQLTEWGKVALLETRGRLSGRPVRAAIGFIEEPDGSLLVAAGSEEADWALNLLSEPECSAVIADRQARYVAQQIEGVDRARALSGLILKYGTPAERLGRGPVFRLRPL